MVAYSFRRKNFISQHLVPILKKIFPEVISFLTNPFVILTTCQSDISRFSVFLALLISKAVSYKSIYFLIILDFIDCSESIDLLVDQYPIPNKTYPDNDSDSRQNINILGITVNEF